MFCPIWTHASCHVQKKQALFLPAGTECLCPSDADSPAQAPSEATYLLLFWSWLNPELACIVSAPFFYSCLQAAALVVLVLVLKYGAKD